MRDMVNRRMGITARQHFKDVREGDVGDQDNPDQNEETDVKTSNEEDTKVTEEIDQNKVIT